MDRCPEISELNAFFGGTHVQLYPDEPEPYSTHRFESITADGRIVCELLPGEDELRFMWWQTDYLTMDVKLQGLRSLYISRSAGDVTLVGNVDAGDLRQLFKLKVHPKVCFQWSSASQFG